MEDRLEHAKLLVQILGKYVRERNDAANIENLRVASEWLRLMNDDAPLAGDIESLIKALDQLPTAGSITIDLKISATPWAIRARRIAILRCIEK